jgi:hypothetical protein
MSPRKMRNSAGLTGGHANFEDQDSVVEISLCRDGVIALEEEGRSYGSPSSKSFAQWITRCPRRCAVICNQVLAVLSS